jgi:hypothetical protein
MNFCGECGRRVYIDANSYNTYVCTGCFLTAGCCICSPADLAETVRPARNEPGPASTPKGSSQNAFPALVNSTDNSDLP